MSSALPPIDDFGKIFEEAFAETFASELYSAEAAMYNDGYIAGSEVGYSPAPYIHHPLPRDYVPNVKSSQLPASGHDITDYRHPLHQRFFNARGVKEFIQEQQRYASIGLTQGFLGKQGRDLQQDLQGLLNESMQKGLWYEALQVVAESVVIEWPSKVYKRVTDQIGEDYDRPPLYHIKKPGGEKEKETGVRKEMQMFRLRWLAVPMKMLQAAQVDVRIVDHTQPSLSFQNTGKVEARHLEGRAKNDPAPKLWNYGHRAEPKVAAFKEPVEVLMSTWIKQNNERVIDELEFSMENFTIAACNRGEKKPLRLNELKLDIVLDFGFGQVHYGECRTYPRPKNNRVVVVQHQALRTEPFYVLTSMTQVSEHLLLRTYALLQRKYCQYHQDDFVAESPGPKPDVKAGQASFLSDDQDRALPFSIIDRDFFRTFLQSRCDVELRELDELELRHIYMKVLLPYLTSDNTATSSRAARGKRSAQSSRSSLNAIEEKIEYLFGKDISEPIETEHQRQAIFLKHRIQDDVEMPLSYLQGVFMEWFYGVADMLGESNRGKPVEAKPKKEGEETKKSTLLCEVPNNRQRSFMPYLFNEKYITLLATHHTVRSFAKSAATKSNFIIMSFGCNKRTLAFACSRYVKGEKAERNYEHFTMGLDELKHLKSGIGGALPFAFAHHYPSRYQHLAKFVEKPNRRIKLNRIFDRSGELGVFRIVKPDIKPSFLYGSAPNEADNIELEINEIANSLVAKSTLSDDVSSVATEHRVLKRGNHLTGVQPVIEA